MESERRIRALVLRLAEVEDDQRRQVTRELHEQAGQNLSAISINLNLVSSLLPGDVAGTVKDRLSDSLALVEETTRHIRNVIAELRPPVLDDYGLEAALRWYCKRFSESCGAAIEVRSDKLLSRPPGRIESTLFRVAQEALANVAKHADASNIIVTLEDVEGLLRLIIADDGCGFDMTDSDSAEERSGWGLIMIKELGTALGGEVRIESEQGRGTRIIIEITR